ncbi:MAG: hypothetical protein K6A94_03130 [Bacteroidales bacterium]|nr:hypothetical protein [Bacteroidales bacterium]
MNIDIQNNKECFVALWQQLERTRQLFGMQYKRFCIRRVLRSWMPTEATDEFIWEVCRLASYDEANPICGYDVLPPPALHPRKSRELLRALVAVKLGIGMRKVNLKALDEAYSIIFPHSTKINVNKKKKAVAVSLS